jgi:hypothetical protein
MSFLRIDNGEVLVAGHQNSMFRIDVEQGCIIEEVASTSLRQESVGRLNVRRYPPIMSTVS